MSPNFATVIHKFIRSEMFGVSLSLSTCDADDPVAVERVAARLERVAALLHTHGEKEDEAFLPVLRARDPGAAARMQRDHEILDQRLTRVRAAAAALAETGEGESGHGANLLPVYLEWNAFLASYLEHLDDEELRLFPLLGDAMPGMGAMAGAAAQIPEEARAGFLDALWKTLAPTERAAIETALADLETAG